MITNQSRQVRVATPSAAPARIPELFHARPAGIYRYLITQPASFWLVNFYLFIEYVRPQGIYTSIDILPWGLTAIMLTILAFALEGRSPHLHTVMGGLLMFFSLVLVLSSVTALYPSTSFAGWELYFSWVLIYVLITNTVVTEKRFFIFVLAFLLYSFKMSQHGFRTWLGNGFGFSDWGATGGPGWFHNSGEFGIQMCIFLPLSVEFILAFRPYWNKWTRWFFYTFPITAVASMIASSSRGALLGGACVALWWVARSKHRVRAAIAVALLGLITWTVVPEEQKTRFSTAGEDETSISRMDRWEDGLEMAKERPLLGIGYNNWQRYYGPLSHNIFIEAVSELGYTGLIAFLAMILGTFILNARTRRLVRGLPTSTKFLHHMAFGLDGALIGFMASGFFVTVLYYPYFWVNLAMTVSLHMAARHERNRLRSAATSAAPVPSGNGTAVYPSGARVARTRG